MPAHDRGSEKALLAVCSPAYHGTIAGVECSQARESIPAQAHFVQSPVYMTDVMMGETATAQNPAARKEDDANVS